MGKLLLIDGMSILHRAFYGVPLLTNAEGLHTNGVYGFLNIMFKILEEEQPDYLAVAFDVKAPTFRHLLYKEYKGTRKEMPTELAEQIPVMKEMLSAMGIEMCEKPGLEADDILGTLANAAERDGHQVTLVSGDRDLLQIASDTIKILIPKTKQGRTEVEAYYAKDVEAAYGVTPKVFIDLKALMGDASDNIPGVPKVGQVTASQLLGQFGTLDNLYAHVNEVSKKNVRESLIARKDLADLSRVLATIKTDGDVSLDYEKARAGNYYTPEAYLLCKKLELKSIIKRFEEASLQASVKENSYDMEIIEDFGRAEELFEKLLRDSPALEEQGGHVGVNEKSARDEQDGRIAENERTAWDGKKKPAVAQLGVFLLQEKKKIYAMALSEGTNVWVLPAQGFLTPDYLTDKLKRLSETKELSFFGIKDYYPWLCEERVDSYGDLIIAAYLCNPLKNDYDCVSIAREYLDMTIPALSELTGKKDLTVIWDETPEKLYSYIADQAYAAFHAYGPLMERLKSMGMEKLYREMEMPLSMVLYSMEREGVIARKEELAAYGEALTGRIGELEQNIWRQAGREFNIQSPKQLGEVLFEEMKLPGAKKTKTGYSTAADVLERLAPEYPIVNDILEYRALTKLKSTYADGLSAFISEDGRIHTIYQQTVTATGRLSSTDPNLQNIPMRTELGRQIRKVFVPKPGYVFMDADYSQIELRVLAHMSGDEHLIEAYAMSEDIHRITASKVFHVPLEEVTDLQRRNAKAVNFGIVYGISSFGLSQDLSISPKEAKVYIDQYFETYPGIRAFLDRMVQDAKDSGYAETMYGRRRPIPELRSNNFAQRSFGERVAMNSPIQGTAADIMKIAMIRVWRRLREAGLESRLILQVHDELVIETKESEVEQVREILYDSMKNAADLKVELEVDLHTGTTWYEAK
ncbi:MAG: DNA polymerase I [Lachnospiraceae bacterium]|nr:DNA polymerase I [Lachnospiraceae bacterium]